MTEFYIQSNDMQILTAKLSDFAYYNHSQYVSGDRILIGNEYENWRYYQFQNLDNSVKNIMFCVKNDETKQLVIVFKGSEPSIFDLEGFISDWCISDFYMLVGKLPIKFFDCLKYVRTVKEQFSEYEIFITGHSLGGSMAQLLCSLEENSQILAYTFNAYGVKHLVKCLIENNLPTGDCANNIYNFSIDKDIVSNKDSHIGSVNKIE